jgi:AAA+ superfamily predicted ATPase
MKKIVNIALLNSILSISAYNDQESIIPKNLEKVFADMDSSKIADEMITREKRKILQAFLAREGISKKNMGDEVHFYKPVIPKVLSEEQRKEKIYDRISKKYIGEIPSQVKDIINFIRHYESCTEKDIGVSNRLLLYGQPGTGKSHLVKVLAEELELPLFSYSASYFANKYIGESARRIRRAFEAAKELDRPTLIFIDEIDALASQRNSETHSEYRAILATLLTELQDLQDDKNIIVIVATNDFNSLDNAIKDRFAGSRCEIKKLSTENKAKLYQKVYADIKNPVSGAFASRLAEVTNDNFSNRDIEYIAKTSIFKWFTSCKEDPATCNKNLSYFVRQSMNSTGKEGTFATFVSTYSDGI